MTWTEKHLVKSWEEVGGCWGLYRTCLKERFDISLPTYPAIAITDVKALVRIIHEETDTVTGSWLRPATPQEGDCVVMSSVHNVFNHVGYYLGNGLVLHSTKKSNTGISKLSHLDLQGYKKYKFVRHE